MPTVSSAGHLADFRLVLRSRFKLILKLVVLIGVFLLIDHFRRTQDFIQFVPDNLLSKDALPPLKYNDSGAPSHCYCNDELFCFKGVNKQARTEYGRPFNCSLYEGLNKNGLLFDQIQNTRPHYEDMNEDWEPVFVTSVADNHVPESRTLINRIRNYYPTSKIVIFDIGLSSSAVDELNAVCKVEVKAFNFSKYPAHVTQLKNYSFKLVLLEALQLFKAFFYYDTSVLIQSANIHASFLEAVKSGLLPPFSTHLYTYHSVYAATHPTMYEYLPVPPEAVQIEEVQSSTMFVVDSPYTRRVMKWWYLCAMTPQCIAPEGSNVNCDVWKYKDRWHVYMNCHRYDQSFWNIYSIAELFGEERQALRLKYVDTDFDYIDRPLVEAVEKTRHRILNTFFKPLVKIKRGNPTKRTLKMPCYNAHDDEANN